jgi:hypothetical protein
MSLRQTMLAVIAESAVTGSVTLTQTLQKRLGRAVGLHEVQHILGSLRNDGLITFREESNGSQKRYLNIRISAHGPKPLDIVEDRTPEQLAADGDAIPLPPPSWADARGRVERAAAAMREARVEIREALDIVEPDEVPDPAKEFVRPPEPTPPDGFPILSRLLRREGLRDKAAELLSEAGLDAEAVRVLDVPLPTSDVEAEYLRFARAHHGTAA